MTEPTALAVALNGKTRSQVAHDAHAKAVDRLESLSIELARPSPSWPRPPSSCRSAASRRRRTWPFRWTRPGPTFRVREFTRKEQRGENP